MKGMAATLCVLALCGTAGADTARVRHTPRAVVERLGPAVPLPNPMPAVVRAGCDGDYVSCTGPGQAIYLAPLSFSPRRDYWHELGHQFDYTVLQDWQRFRFGQLLGDLRPWRSPPPESPHERFAEAYALCALVRRRARSRVNGGYGYMPPMRTHRRVCALISAGS